jgi:hypothetical protein
MAIITILLGTVLALVAPGPAAAQVDLARALIGKWEGQVQFADTKANPNRTLVISSVSQNEGRWVAEGQWGVTGERLAKVQIQVEQSGKDVSLRFETRANPSIRLKLEGDKHLLGTMELRAAGRGGKDRPVKLEKVE